LQENVKIYKKSIKICQKKWKDVVRSEGK